MTSRRSSFHTLSLLQRRLFIAAVALGLLAGAFAGLMTFRFLRMQRETLAAARADARRATAAQAAAIEARLRAVMPVANGIAADLSAGRLDDPRVNARLQAGLEANPDILQVGIVYRPFAKSPRLRLFAPHADATTGDVFQLEDRYDYTEYPWFKDAMAGGPHWGEPYFDEDAKALVVGYSAPFFRPGDDRKETIGFVRTNLPLAQIRKAVSTQTLGQTGYGFLLSRKGVYLADPIDDYVRQQRTIFEVADQNHDEARRRLGQRAIAGARDEETGVSGVTGETSLIFAEPIPVAGWSLGSVVVRDEVAVPPREVRRGIIRIIGPAIFFLFFAALAMHLYRPVTGADIWRLTLTASALMVGSICVIWWLTLHLPDRTDESSVHVIDEPNLQKFVAEHRLLPNVDPIQIPTGVFIRSLRFGSANDMVVSGSIWQRLQPALVGLVTEGVDLPDAEAVDVKEAFRRTGPDGTTIGWNIKATLRESSSGSLKYPFDRATMRMRIAPRDFDKNVVLTPDLSSYQLLIPSTLPGLDHQIVTPGWWMDQSFFSYTQANYATTFGIGNSLSRSRRYELTFNMVAQRQFLDPFISSVLPILVIACLLFGLLIVGSKNTAKIAATGFKATDILRASVALLFPALIAQVNLRTKIGATDIIYIEYFYFVLYTAIIGVAANALLFTLGGRGIAQVRDNLIPKLLFWPYLLGACLAVTLVFLF